MCQAGEPPVPSCFKTASQVQGVGCSRSAVDMHFTQTMFIAAQVHRQVGDFAQSAHCCAVTLQLQLQSGEVLTSRV